MKTSHKIIEFTLDTKTKINVTISKKRMKNMRLSISKLGVVAVSVPYSTTYAYAYQFLVRKRNWIIAQLNKINSKMENNSCQFDLGGHIFLLGRKHNLTLVYSDKNSVSTYAYDDNLSTTSNLNFTINTKQFDKNYIAELFKKWCKKYFLDFFTNRINYLYKQIFKDNNLPSLKIKSMKSMWGNCNYVKRVITLNLYLAKAPVMCIDYVIIHELCHLVHHNHGKEFYILLNTLMPDWKVYKKQLNDYSLSF